MPNESERTLTHRLDLSTAVYQIYEDESGDLWGVRLDAGAARSPWSGRIAGADILTVDAGVLGTLRLEPVTPMDGTRAGKP
jgi:hypothetical protein